MDNHGSIFAIEGMLTFLIWIALIGGVIFLIFKTIDFELNDFQRMAIEEKEIMMVERLIKDRNENNPEEGSAAYNSELKRIESNILDENLLKRLNESQLKEGELEIEKIVLELEDRNEVFVDRKADGECVQIERMILIGMENKKGIVKVRICADP